MNAFFFTFSKRNHLFFLAAIFTFSLVGPIVANQLPTPSDTDPSHIAGLTKFNLYFISLLFAPITETILFQYIPFTIAKRIFKSEILILLAIAAPFSIAHFTSPAPLPSLINGIIGGLSLGVCYIICARNSHIHAFTATSIIHSAHNAFVLFLI